MFHRLGVLLAVILAMLSAVPAFAVDGNPEPAVYAMSNDHNGNTVVMYERAANGALTLVGSFATGGIGRTTEPDDALGSQNPLILSPDGEWLFAVNAGSNSITSFKVKKKELKLDGVVPSGGDFPASLTLHGNLLYVLNAGGDANITGFTVDSNGNLTPLAGSTRSLNAGGNNPPFFLDSPAQIGFNPAGDKLVVTVKGAAIQAPKIHVFAIDGNGLPSAQPVTTTARVPFGFVFDAQSNLIVAEPFGAGFPPPGTKGAAGSYQIAADGSLVEISMPVGNGQTATCWIAITPDGRFAYTTNIGTSNISSYSVASDGSLTLLNSVAAASCPRPVDLTITPDGAYMYNV
ncbi:MAG: beta-propeller fold lactonase family protein, partial [Caldilineaceae bacterium]|nr:beta-propeller fold lactonase family protein [Caldilineaceae bacterium]